MEERELHDALIGAMEKIGAGQVIDLLIAWISKGLYLEIFTDLQDKSI